MEDAQVDEIELEEVEVDGAAFWPITRDEAAQGWLRRPEHPAPVALVSGRFGVLQKEKVRPTASSARLTSLSSSTTTPPALVWPRLSRTRATSSASSSIASPWRRPSASAVPSYASSPTATLLMALAAKPRLVCRSLGPGRTPAAGLHILGLHETGTGAETSREAADGV